MTPNRLYDYLVAQELATIKAMYPERRVSLMSPWEYFHRADEQECDRLAELREKLNFRK